MGDRQSDRKGADFCWDSAVSHESSRLMARSHVQYLFWPDRHAPSVPTPPRMFYRAHGLNRWLRPVEALERQAIGPADEHE